MSDPFILIVINADDRASGLSAARFLAQGVDPAPSATSPSVALRKADRLYRARRSRLRDLPAIAELFHDPAWDILLDLYVRGETGKLTSVSSACIGASVAPTTALRVLNELAKREAIVFEQDKDDRRRRYVSLTAAAKAAMHQWLVSVDIS